MKTARPFDDDPKRTLPFGVPDWLLVAGLTYVAIVLTSHLAFTVEANYTLQADAWIHGRLDVVNIGPWLDVLPWRGGWYVVEAPFPAVLMTPLVLIFGRGANQAFLSAVLGAVATGAAWELCKRLGTSTRARIALTAFFALGTDVFWCAAQGDVWFVAHASAVCFTMLALVEVSGKRRGLLVALYAGAAAFSRYPLLPLLCLYPLLMVDAPRRRRILGSYAGTVAALLVLWVWYNEARWGTVTDIGFELFYRYYYVPGHQGAHAMMLDVHNVPNQLWNFFVHPPVFFSRPPWVGAEQFGLALTYTSPALCCALFARGPVLRIVTLWAMALAAAAPSLLYYDAGGIQFGMRHALDFEPFVFALMVLAVGRRFGWIPTALVAWSVAVGLWGLWFWRTYPPGHPPA